MGKLTPERWPDDGYLRPLFKVVQPAASHDLTAAEMKWPLADLEEKYPPPERPKK
jgi:hypothetical protein